jgi:outer membrane protein TolC
MRGIDGTDTLARQRYKLGLGSVVEVTQSEVALIGAQTRLADAQ